MRAGSLRRRSVAAGVVVVAVVVVALDVFLYVSLRSELYENLDEVLMARVEVVRQIAAGAEPEEVAGRMLEAGVPGVVERADGRRLAVDPVQRRPVPVTAGAHRRGFVSEVVSLGDGGRVIVQVSTAGLRDTLADVIVFGVAGTVLAVAIAVVLLTRATRVALKPLDDMVSTAREIASGELGQRIRPDRIDTDVGRMAAAFDEMLDALEQALGDARAAENRNRVFLADAAHQLRTPITAIRASAELLASGAVPAEQRQRLLDNLVLQGERIGVLLNALLRMARLDEGETLDRYPADLVDVCRREVERMRPRAEGIEVRLSVPDDAAIGPVDLDPSWMQEAVGNVLNNCVRHAGSFVDVAVRRAGHVVEVEISDDGPGMDDATAARAFQRFFTLDRRGGSGLGLPIAKGIVEAHAGELRYEDGRFIIRLPAGPAPGVVSGMP